MITPKQIEKVTMSPEKRESAKLDYFAFYIGRPLSYILTIPFLYTKLTPNTISVLSIIPLIVGFLLCYIGNSQEFFLYAWGCFFLWNLLDGVDGNVARYKKQFSVMGSVFDAMSGYVAMLLAFFGWGVIASHNTGLFQDIISIPNDLYIVLGALSSVFAIFPRLIMHKAITTLGKKNAIDEIKNKANYGLIKTITLNLTSVAGLAQVIMLVSVLTNTEDFFTVGYFCLNLLVMIVSLKTILRHEN